METEKHESDLKKVNLEKKAAEDKYGRIVKEREAFKEKEDAFLDICKALKELRDIKMDPGKNTKKDSKIDDNPDKRTTEKAESEPAIDITGEETQGGTSSVLFACDKCEYRTSMENRLNQHKNNKHVTEIIPCEFCKYKGSLEEFAVHMKNTHNNPPCSNGNKNSEHSNENRKQTTQNVRIPCDICDFVASSTRMYTKHIESKHQPKVVNNSNEMCLPCEKCSFVAKTEFKCHLEERHGLKVKEETKNNSSGKLCIYWNRGHCSFNQKCKFVHEGQYRKN